MTPPDRSVWAHTTGCTCYSAAYESATMTSARTHWLYRNSSAIYLNVTHSDTQKSTNSINFLIPSSVVHLHTNTHTFTQIPAVLQYVPRQWEVLTVVTSPVLPWPCARQSRATAWYAHRQGQHPTAATHTDCRTPEQQSSRWRMGDWTKLHLVSLML